MATTLQILITLLAISVLHSALPIEPALNALLQLTNVTSSLPASLRPNSNARTIPVAHDRTLNPTVKTRDSLSIQAFIAAATGTNPATQPQKESSWNSGVISTVVFGCIASILGTLAIWATIWLGRRPTGCITRNNISTSQAPLPNPVLGITHIEENTSHHATTNSVSVDVPNPAEPAQLLWGTRPRDAGALHDDRDVVEAPPQASLPPIARL